MKNTFSFEEVTQLLLDERTIAIEIALSFKKLHESKFAEEQKQKLAVIGWTNKEKAQVSKIIAENISGITTAQQISSISEKQIITQKLIEYCNARKKIKNKLLFCCTKEYFIYICTNKLIFKKNGC